MYLLLLKKEKSCPDVGCFFQIMFIPINIQPKACSSYYFSGGGIFKQCFSLSKSLCFLISLEDSELHLKETFFTLDAEDTNIESCYELLHINRDKILFVQQLSWGISMYLYASQGNFQTVQKNNLGEVFLLHCFKTLSEDIFIQLKKHVKTKRSSVVYGKYRQRAPIIFEQECCSTEAVALTALL